MPALKKGLSMRVLHPQLVLSLRLAKEMIKVIHFKYWNGHTDITTLPWHSMLFNIQLKFKLCKTSFDLTQKLVAYYAGHNIFERTGCISTGASEALSFCYWKLGDNEKNYSSEPLSQLKVFFAFLEPRYPILHYWKPGFALLGWLFLKKHYTEQKAIYPGNQYTLLVIYILKRNS